jgi:hypothetical protein
MASKTRKFFVVFTMVVYVLFAILAAVGAVGGIALLFFAPPLGIIFLLSAVVLGVFSWQVKRTFDSLTEGSSGRLAP